MGDSFTFRKDPFPSFKDGKRKVLVTGAAGNIGSHFCQAVKDRYQLRLMVRGDENQTAIYGCGEIVEASLMDQARLVEVTGEIDTIVHLAANPSPKAKWSSILTNNIEGTYHLFQAAIENQCRRVVFASSIHAVSGYPVDRQVHPDDPPNPGDVYGVSKAFGEALARYASTQHGLSTIVVRLGACRPAEVHAKKHDMNWINSFISYSDLSHLFSLCIDDEKLDFAIVHGLSENLFNRMDITTTRDLLGYEPQNDYSEIHPELRKLNLRGEVHPHSETQS